jgi:hypothetical protein
VLISDENLTAEQIYNVDVFIGGHLQLAMRIRHLE